MPRLEAWKMPRVVRWVLTFFDIDGTLLELGKKEMHQELVDALNLVK